MRRPPIFLAPVAFLALCSLTSCNPDAVSSPQPDLVALMDHAGFGGSHVLTVDDDREQCRRADFTTIQEAVTAAEPRTTILVCAGTYEEQVLITKNELRLVAHGKPGEVVLDGLDLATMIAGFQLDNAHGNLIQGFLIRNYHEAGIWLRLGSSRNTIRMNVTTSSSHHDGIQVLNSPQNVIEHNTSFANPSGIACGINIAGAQSVGNIVRHNETFENQFGVQVAGGAANNVIFHNWSHDNRRLGIRNIAGANGTVIENNRVNHNVFEGIAVLNSTGVTVARNRAFDNVPDLFWDGVGVNTFENNHCETSAPPGLCKD